MSRLFQKSVMIAALATAGLVGSSSLVMAQIEPPAREVAVDNDAGAAGLWGLVGLIGLFGLAGRSYSNTDRRQSTQSGMAAQPR